LPRLSTSSISRTNATHGGRNQHNRAKPVRYEGDEFHRKLSMDAYYRPQQSISIDADIWDEDEDETDVSPFA
jgi:hypothetical protein